MASNQLGIIWADFSNHLQSLEYVSSTVRDSAGVAEHFGRWLKTRRIRPPDITVEIKNRVFLCLHLPPPACPLMAFDHQRTGAGEARSSIVPGMQWIQPFNGCG